MQQLKVIKIGGNILDDDIRLKEFLQAFSKLEGYKILIHGGGKIATEIGLRLGIEPNYVNGRRVTDEETLELVTMVYGGLVNKQLVAQLQYNGCNAIGLTGADGNIMKAKKRIVKETDYGHVGDIERSGVDTESLRHLIVAGFIPVIAPLTHDGRGNMLNTNADTIAQEIAKAMSSIMEVHMIYCFEKNGVLANADDDTSVISTIRSGDFEALKTSGTVSGGMLPKLENAFAAISSGVNKVVIGKAEELHGLIEGTAGTTIL